MNKKSLETVDVACWYASFSPELQKKAVDALEAGKILYFPTLAFPLKSEELPFLSPEKIDPKAKNISYDSKQNRLGKVLCTDGERDVLKELMKRYAASSRNLLDSLIPHYKSSLTQAKTSLRPVEISGRTVSSYRKDDKRLHVDSFPSSPVKGQRILRLFTNVNPDGKPRVWRAGEPFEDVVTKIAPKVSHPIWGAAAIMKLLGITKDLRTDYDHYMLQIHDAMKKDMDYQQTVPQEEIHFPSGSSWAVFTDQVSHAAMSGQHVFEQTFYLPPNGIKNPETTPLAILERYFNKKLV